MRDIFLNPEFKSAERFAAFSIVDVEGFKISPFSGTYFLHLIWTLPTIFLILTFFGSFKQKANFAVLALLSTVFVLLVREIMPLVYYNFRYFLYVYPFLFVGAWHYVSLLSLSTKRQILVFILALSPLLTYSEVFELRRKRAQNPLIHAFENQRYPFREYFSQKIPIYVPEDRTLKFLVSYYSRRQVQDIADLSLFSGTAYIVAPSKDSVLQYCQDSGLAQAQYTLCKANK